VPFFPTHNETPSPYLRDRVGITILPSFYTLECKTSGTPQFSLSRGESVSISLSPHLCAVCLNGDVLPALFSPPPFFSLSPIFVFLRFGIHVATRDHLRPPDFCPKTPLPLLSQMPNQGTLPSANSSFSKFGMGKFQMDVSLGCSPRAPATTV